MSSDDTDGPCDADMAALLIRCLDLTSLNEGDDAVVVEALAERGLKHQVAALCINPELVSVAIQALRSSDVKVATVANFPDGGDDIGAVAEETERAVGAGAHEVDIVAPIAAVKAGDVGIVDDLIGLCRDAAGPDTVLKLILETGALETPDRIVAVSRAAVMAGIDFLKTSTGKIKVGATMEAASAMLEVSAESGGLVGFKASGGVRTADQAAGYFRLAQSKLGPDWPTPRRFRIGASSLLDDLLKAG
ncbi:MAG: deoxyribose-phosphate aldolase [Geminicoccaceae bacterium]